MSNLLLGKTANEKNVVILYLNRQSFKGAVVNQTYHSLNGGSLENTFLTFLTFFSLSLDQRML